MVDIVLNTSDWLIIYSLQYGFEGHHLLKYLLPYVLFIFFQFLIKVTNCLNGIFHIFSRHGALRRHPVGVILAISLSLTCISIKLENSNISQKMINVADRNAKAYYRTIHWYASEIYTILWGAPETYFCHVFHIVYNVCYCELMSISQLFIL